MKRDLVTRHDKRYWPEIPTILVSVASANREVRGDVKDEPYVMDTNRIWAERMLKGESIPDGYLFGRMAYEIKRDHDITDEQLDGYRRSFLSNLQGTLGVSRGKSSALRYLKRHVRAAETFNFPLGDDEKRIAAMIEDIFTLPNFNELVGDLAEQYINASKGG